MTRTGNRLIRLETATRLLLAIVLTTLLLACSPSSDDNTTDPRSLSWPEIEQAARGQTVYFVMWTGDPAINRYMNEFVVPRLRERHGINLEIVPGQADIPSMLMTEMEAGQSVSSMDMVWINGQVFYQLRQIDALYGPFTGRLPNDRYLDWDNPMIATDFQQKVNGYESPWGNVQLLLIIDRARVPNPPRTPHALAEWIRGHPGRFTFDNEFTGLSFLKSLMYTFAESPRELQGPFDPEVYEQLKNRVFDWVRGVRADLWRGGRTFPKDVAQLHQLFANGEVDFTMSFNDGEVDNKVAIGLFPKTATAYALKTGTLQNTHYLGIVARSAHKAAAMVVANFLISPAAQLEKLKPAVWGDGTVLAVERLPEPWRSRFKNVPGRSRAPAREDLQPYARPEPAPQYMIRLDEDFRNEILRQ
ncbi:MAG: ABC transporter substrate-binding protein [Gammaproteobacteria bacterium]|nr:ABC transporter substrate-binding protein [Gammaproteobacteria bacterium]